MSLALVPDTSDWRTDGACRGADPELFFPERGEDTSRAMAICAECPVRTDCLEHALATDEKAGIWGGTTGRQRAAIRRKRGPRPNNASNTLAYLRAHGPSTPTQVAKGTGMPIERVHTALGWLLTTGRATRTGYRSTAVYQAAPDA